MREQVKVAFASGSEERISPFVERFATIEPALPLYVVSEFPPPAGQWVPYRVGLGLWENYVRCRAAFRNKNIRWAGVLFEPKRPYWRMRLVGFMMAPLRVLAYNENLDHTTFRPRGLPVVARHFLWKMKELVRFEVHPGGRLYTFLWRVAHPRAFRRPVAYLAARAAGAAAALLKNGGTASPAIAADEQPDGISVVIPSRSGKDMLAAIVPQSLEQLQGRVSEVIVADNGSDDGTAEWLRATYPEVVVEASPEPLSFARAVNRGVRRARYARLCLLNNDMTIEPGFFAGLERAFDQVPDLFAATAQIFFPEGVRREETGKAVMPPRGPRSTDFPVSCELPIAGEDLSYVLYGSGGCTLYSAARWRALGGLDEAFAPAYCEDLDLGVRAWQRGWPTVFAAGARVVHQHRATTSRYHPPEELERVLETNYLRFLARAISGRRVFGRLWKQALTRLNLLAVDGRRPAMDSLAAAWRIAWSRRRGQARGTDEELVLALAGGEVAVFPGRARQGRPAVLVGTCYLPFPLSHGGAVRMYNLMRRAAADFDQVLVAFTDELATPPAELLDITAEIVLVRRRGSHARRRTSRPDVVEEFDSRAFRAALRQTAAKWRPKVAQLEFTQMAQYAADCAPARTILVEHDITLDLYRQLLAQSRPGIEEYDTRKELARWERFERRAWRQVDCVVAMSEKDRRAVTGRRVVTLPNGVDLERFRPVPREPEPARLLFIGSFAHLPNLLAMSFFLEEVWPSLEPLAPVLHVIAGARHHYHLERFPDAGRVKFDQPRIELEGFVADPRPAYARAAIVIAPLLASAGTNIKILEAMAMGKAIVSTPAGINGLDLAPGRDVLVTPTAGEMAWAISNLISDPRRRRALEIQARATAERHYGWDDVARSQKDLYQSLL